MSILQQLRFYYSRQVCLWQKDFSRLNASSRADGSTANVIRSQFLRPTAIPATTFSERKHANDAYNQNNSATKRKRPNATTVLNV